MLWLSAQPLVTDPGERRASMTMLYALAVGSSFAAAAIGQAISPFAGPHTISSPYLLAVLISAAAGGIGPGLLATVVTTLLMAWLEVGPERTLDLGFDDLIKLAVFAITALVVSFLATTRRTAERRLRESYQRMKDHGFQQKDES